MDLTEQEPQYRAPRSSRLPLPRATTHSTSARAGGEIPAKAVSHLPRLSGTSSLRLKASAPLSDSSSRQSRNGFGWNSQRFQAESSPTGVASDDQSNSLEATPPRATSFQYVEGDENSASAGPDPEKQKRKPRPSLSERTLETLSNVPPSPSPSKRRVSMVAGTTGMRPPSRPVSSLKTSRSNASLRARSTSPSKLPQRTPDRAHSPLHDVPPVPLIYGSGRVSTLNARAGANGTKSTQQIRHVSAITKNGELTQSQHRGSSSFASKAKTVHELRGGKLKSSSARPCLASIFSEPSDQTSTSVTKTPLSERKFKVSSQKLETIKKQSGKASANTSRATQYQQEKLPAEVHGISPSKSSMTLRETIARAKAAKKEASKSSRNLDTKSNTGSTMGNDAFSLEQPAATSGHGTLQQRMKTAITTGFLNLAAMDFENLPRELLKMYDFDENNKVSWSEAVDLTKLIAADNKLEKISDDFFPDWSVEELEADDDKSNQFGGLQILNLRGNCLTSLPMGLRRLDQLRTLDLSNNQLHLKAFEVICQISSVKELNLSNNNIEGVLPTSLSRLYNLQVLDLHSNQLSMVSEATIDLPRLQKLDLSSNRLEDISLAPLHNSSLIELNLSKNSLSGCLFPEGFTLDTLKDLNVGFNRLRSLSDGEVRFPNLQNLICDYNQIEKLPDLGGFKSLTSLTASENKIAQLPGGLIGLELLRNVNLSANQIRVLDPLIANMESLAAMNLVANPLRDRKYLTMNTADLKLDLAKRLVRSTDNEDCASNNQLNPVAPVQPESEYRYKPHRGVLNLSSQSLASIDISMIDLNQPIHTLRLSNNELTIFPTELLDHHNVKNFLRSLDVSHNQTLHPTGYITDDLSLPVLESLYVVSTGLTSLQSLLDHLSAPSLKELNISCHRMTGPVPAAKTVFPSLTTLLATDNWFTSIEIEDVRGLEVLDIRNNDIDQLPPKLGELGNPDNNKTVAGRLRAFECSGNRFRVPRPAVLEKGTEAVLKDLRRMVPLDQVDDEWRD